MVQACSEACVLVKFPEDTNLVVHLRPRFSHRHATTLPAALLGVAIAVLTSRA